jgi:arylsulfatase
MLLATALLSAASLNAQDRIGSVLPFPPTAMDSVAKPRLQDSTMKWPQQPQRLPADAPNILIVLLDDTGFGVSETFGGEVHTPTFSKLAKEGLR